MPQARISVGVDGGPGGWGALAWAIEEAMLRRARLHVIHCGTSAAVTETAHGRVLSCAPNVEVIAEITDKPAPVALLEAARHSGIVVAGPPSASRQFSELLSRSTALHVAIRAHRPVVIAHQRPST
ncbi:MAG: hypothetical protein J2P17_20340, partial [Mycobacterium sp.]|nr:hypothetical protein [Mycobacterium sp.]